MLGSIEDVHIDEKNNQIFVLDTQEIGIKVFDFEGNYLKKISRKGKRPGELIRPTKIEVLGDKIYILDRRNSIKIFRKESSELSYQETIVSEFPEDFCISENFLFSKNMTVSSPESINNNNNSIFQYTHTNFEQPSNNFGKMYQTDYWGTKMHMSIGGIVCSRNSGIVVQYFGYLNFLYAFDYTGKPVWTSQISNFDFIELIEQGGSLGPDRSNLPLDFDYMENLISLNDNLLLVQIANRTISTRGYFLNNVDTYIINYQNGMGQFISSDLPLIFTITPKHIAFYNQTEYPKVEIAKY